MARPGGRFSTGGYGDPVRLAAIDMGSNSFHLLVVEARPGGTFALLTREKEMLRLGDVVAEHGLITPEAEERAAACLERFAHLCISFGVHRVAAYATAALRDAVNGPDVVARLRERTQIGVRVITGEEEAKLIYLAVQRSFDLGDRTCLALDIGGGSVEISLGSHASAWRTHSLPIGVARLRARHLSPDTPKPDELAALRDEVHRALRPYVGELAGRADLVVGTSGTFAAVAQLVLLRQGVVPPPSLHQQPVAIADVIALGAEVAGIGARERRRLPGVEQERADLLPSGLALIEALADALRFSEYQVGTWALREGMVLSTMARVHPVLRPERVDDNRRRVVSDLAGRFDWEEAHARHVAANAVVLGAGLAGILRISPPDLEVLEFGCLLHDVGHQIGLDAHHRHSAYIIEHAALPGFSAREQLLLAAMARYHRRSEMRPDKEYLASLGPADQRLAVALTAVLRVADGLDRSGQQDVHVRAVSLHADEAVLVVACPRDPELELWSAARKGALLEQVLGRPLRFEPEPAATRT